ncbi:hypothetical protein ABIA33_002430 [Streptacidiphilus sp. MAP12-16]|uniref:hypothetical protein n=1 Tax=Streptacidiphilus sp. MAP12-16 TaxID=3156300 RepID=UPI0035185CA4
MADADELLERIRRAREWAHSRAEQLFIEGSRQSAAHESQAADIWRQVAVRTSVQMEVVALVAVRNVLDQILAPGPQASGER